VDLQQVANTSFVLVQADWPVDKGRRLIEKLGPSHIIVHRKAHEDLYYLYTASEALYRLDQAPGAVPIGRALDLHESDATPLREMDADAETAPDWCVLHEGGRVVGFLDAGAVSERTRGPQTGGADAETEQPEAVGRSLIAEFPRSVARGHVAWLLVQLSAAPAVGTGIPVSALPVADQLDILVQARQGFVVQGNDRVTVTMTGDKETLPFQFKLLAADLGPGRIDVLAFHQGQALGRISLSSTIEEGLHASRSEDDGPRRDDRPLAPITVRVPDLSMLVEERKGSGEVEYMIRLTTSNPAQGLNLKPFGPIQLRADPTAYFANFFEEIEALPVNTSQQKTVAARRLAARGVDLFQKAFPEELQKTLWSLRHSIQSVIVQSEEPWIPWELCKLCGEEDGRVAEGPFLCEAYAITRWVPGLGFKQPLQPQEPGARRARGL
jgi:hypothetical protein